QAEVPAGVGFANFWLHRFRHGGEGQAAQKPEGGSDGVAAMAARLRQLMERGEQREAVAQLLQGLHDHYQQRFGAPAIDPLGLLGTLIESPDRNDILLRQLAGLLAPWLPEPERAEVRPQPLPEPETEPEPLPEP